MDPGQRPTSLCFCPATAGLLWAEPVSPAGNRGVPGGIRER
jgi:hypothetical protein